MGWSVVEDMVVANQENIGDIFFLLGPTKNAGLGTQTFVGFR